MWVRSNTVSCKEAGHQSATCAVRSQANQRCVQFSRTQTNGAHDPGPRKPTACTVQPRKNSLEPMGKSKDTPIGAFHVAASECRGSKDWKPSESSITQASQARRPHARRCAAMRSAPQVEHVQELRYVENPASHACAGAPHHAVSPRAPRAITLHAEPKPRELLLRRLDPSHFLNERREQTRLNLSVLDAFLP